MQAPTKLRRNFIITMQTDPSFENVSMLSSSATEAIMFRITGNFGHPRWLLTKNFKASVFTPYRPLQTLQNKDEFRNEL